MLNSSGGSFALLKLLVKVMDRGSDIVVSGGEMLLLISLRLPTRSIVVSFAEPLRACLCFAVVSASALMATFCFLDMLAVGFPFPCWLIPVVIIDLGCPRAGSILSWSRRCTL